jgi:hypothetical protein
MNADFYGFLMGWLVYALDVNSSKFKNNVSADNESFGKFSSSCLMCLILSMIWVFSTRLYLWGALQWARPNLPREGTRDEGICSAPKSDEYALGFAPLFESVHGMCVGVSVSGVTRE